MDNQIILNEGLELAANNITFTVAEWNGFVQRVNNELAMALFYGLIIGAMASAGGMFLAQWYNGRKR
jgi:hypothetical protein